MAQKWHNFGADGYGGFLMAEWERVDRGIRVRRHPTRKHGQMPDKYFVIRYRVDGQYKQEALGWASQGWTLAKARAELAKLKEAARTGIGEVTLREKREKAQAIREAEKNKPTVQALWEIYYAINKNKPGMHADKNNIKASLIRFGDKSPDEIYTLDIEKFRSDLEKEGFAPQTVKHKLSILSRVIRFGAKRGLCKFPDMSKQYFTYPKVDNKKTEFLTPEQIKNLIHVLKEEKNQNLASLMLLALYTGMRRSALLGLEWEDIDFTNRTIRLRGEIAKNGKTLTIPMSETACKILSNIEHLGSKYVFPGKNGEKRVEIRRFTDKIKKKAQLPQDFRPLHGLRHTFASLLASSGKVPLFSIQRLLTHESQQMTERYSHLADSALRQATETLDDLIDWDE